MADSKQSIYEKLSKINVKPYLKDIPRKSKKTGYVVKLSYLSWAKALGLVKAIYPDTTYKIKDYPNYVKTEHGIEQAGTLDYRITSVGCEVEVTVTIDGHDFTQKLYPMDRTNKPIMKPNIEDINKAQLRCLVKALATAGLGLDVYAGEDLPSDESETVKKPARTRKTQQPTQPKQSSTKALYAKIKSAKAYEIEYGGSKEKLVDVIGLENSGDEQAKLFLDDWRKKDAKNDGAYKFVIENGLATKKAEA